MSTVARAMWKASLELGPHRLPVKLYAAAVDRAVHFRLVHAKDGVPVQRRLVNPRTGDAVAGEDAIRGVRVEPGTYVVVRKEELAALAPEASRAIRVEASVPESDLDERWFERPYYLGPDGASEGYTALTEALAAEALCGIATWTMRGHSYRGALVALDGALALVTLRPRAEVLRASRLPAPSGKDLSQGELKLAAQLLETMTGELDWGAWRDTHRERVEKLVRDKRAGRTPRVRRFKPSVVRDDGLAAALKASLKRAG